MGNLFLIPAIRRDLARPERTRRYALLFGFEEHMLWRHIDVKNDIQRRVVRRTKSKEDQSERFIQMKDE